MAGLEHARGDVGADLHAHVVARVDSHQLVQDQLDLVLMLDLDHHRGRQLPRHRQQSVVDLDLLGDPRRIHDALDPAHFLDLEEHGVAILEDEGKVLAHRHPPHALELDHPLAHGRAHLLVLEEVQDVRSLDLVVGHGDGSSSNP